MKEQKNEELNLNSLIEKNNVVVIKTIIELNELFDTASIYNEIPKINIKSNSVIVFDTPDYNSCYLLEMVLKFNEIINDGIEEATELIFNKNPNNISEEEFRTAKEKLYKKAKDISQTIKIFYCDNLEIQEYLMKPFMGEINNHRPFMLMINKDVNGIFIDIENFLPFSFSDILQNFLIIADAAIINKKYDENNSTSKQKNITIQN